MITGKKDYFLQMFRNASVQNKNVKVLTEKVSKVSQKPSDFLMKNKYLSGTSNGQFDSYEIERERTESSYLNAFDFSSTVKLDELNKLIAQEKKENSFPSNDSYLRYEATTEKEKDLYIQSLKKNLQKFSTKKNEIKIIREKNDLFGGLNDQIDKMVKKKQNENAEKFNQSNIHDKHENFQIIENVELTENGKYIVLDNARNDTEENEICSKDKFIISKQVGK